MSATAMAPMVGNRNDDLRSDFGKRLKQARRKAHLTLEKTAELIGVSLNMVNLWEAGSSFPMPEKLASLADHFGVSVDWLLGREERLRLLREEPAKYMAGADWDEFSPEERQALQTIIDAFAERARRRRQQS